MFDGRVSSLSKLMPFFAILYFISPVDLLPDLTALGMIDDVGLLIVMLNLFIENAPETVLREHLERMSQHDRVLRMVRDMAPLQSRTYDSQDQTDDDIVEGHVSRRR
jgi:uncharacterized membrane protein YkvA (DUF1232 family)